jgi:hypothetical protein
MSSAVPAAAAALYPPGGFRAQASNGYSIHAIAFDGERLGEHDELVLFVSRKDRVGHLRGNLAIDFPGRSGVRLSGARGSLQRWVQTPSHPFRPDA